MSDESAESTEPEVKEAEVIPGFKVEPLPDQTPEHLKNPNGEQVGLTPEEPGEVDAPKAD